MPRQNIPMARNVQSLDSATPFFQVLHDQRFGLRYNRFQQLTATNMLPTSSDDRTSQVYRLEPRCNFQDEPTGAKRLNGIAP